MSPPIASPSSSLQYAGVHWSGDSTTPSSEMNRDETIFRMVLSFGWLGEGRREPGLHGALRSLVVDVVGEAVVLDDDSGAHRVHEREDAVVGSYADECRQAGELDDFVDGRDSFDGEPHLVANGRRI